MLELRKGKDGHILPIQKRTQTVCSPEELALFFRSISSAEAKYKAVLLLQLGCECRINEACAVNIKDFYKGTSYRELDMLIQKKRYKNIIVHKVMPESIAAFIRFYLLTHLIQIKHCNGYIFPPHHNHVNKEHVNPGSIEKWFCKKRKQLAELYPDGTFSQVMGYRTYRHKAFMGKPMGEIIEPLYIWTTHMMKRFAGSYAYAMTQDLKFCQELLAHDKAETTERYYVQSFNHLDRARVTKNKMFDHAFFESICSESDNAVGVWDNITRYKKPPNCNK